MKQEAWIKQLRDRLADHEEAAPADLWAGIEAKLAQQAAPKRPRIVPLWGRWAAAAAILAGVIMGGDYLMNQPDNGQMAISHGASQMAEVQKVDENQTISETEATASSVVMKSQQFVAQLKQVVSSVVTNSDDQPVIAQEQPVEKQLAELIEQPVENQPIEEQPSKQQSSEKQPTAKKQLPTEDDVIRELDRKIAEASNQSQSQAAFGLYASNGFGNQMSSNGVVMNPAMAANYSMDNYRTSGTRGDGEVIYVANLAEEEKHYQPISFGLTTNIPIAPRFSIATGLVYTRLRSDFIRKMSDSEFKTEQTLHYIGIPVNLQYQIWNYRFLKIYASAGGQVDYNIKNQQKQSFNSQTSSDGRDRLQFSMQGAVGLQCDIIPMLGLYIEPGVKYYFNNGSDVRNYFKDKPTNFNLQVGLRLNLGNQ